MQNSVESNLRGIEKRELQLWIITLTLLLILGGFTFFNNIFLSESHSGSGSFNSIAGLFALIIIFCGYALNVRIGNVKTRLILEKQAMRDTLTGLYNRQYFNEQMEMKLLQANRTNTLVAVLLCDLDHFKAINDTKGHHAGDKVLKAVATSIKESTRGIDLVSRWGGDEFVVVLNNTTRKGVMIGADRIRKGIQSIAEKDNMNLDLSIGVALYPEHGRGVDELIRLADRALYIAKKGGGKIHIGEEEYKLDDSAVKVVFQPVVDLKTKKVLGYEALSRDPQGKFCILDLFKRYEAVGQLNELKCICFRLQLKKAVEFDLKKIFINVDFDVLRQVESTPKPPGIDVILEISESESLHDVANNLKITHQWRAKGYKFAIDDFGAGFISLPFISELVPDYIKMDRSTIVKATSSPQFLKFLRDMILALRNYSKEGIIAEGIETLEELDAVKKMGIDPVQGFLLGRPEEMK